VQQPMQQRQLLPHKFERKRAYINACRYPSPSPKDLFPKRQFLSELKKPDGVVLEPTEA